jgi:hypothetical protein
MHPPSAVVRHMVTVVPVASSHPWSPQSSEPMVKLPVT